MAEKFKKAAEPGRTNKKSWFERGSRFGRDFNLVVGSVALAGALVAPPVVAAGLGIYAGINFAQAGGFEIGRKVAAKKRNKNEKK